MRIEYIEHRIQMVFEHWAKSYKIAKGEELYNWEATYDPHTGKVIFKVYIQPKKKQSP